MKTPFLPLSLVSMGQYDWQKLRVVEVRLLHAGTFANIGSLTIVYWNVENITDCPTSPLYGCSNIAYGDDVGLEAVHAEGLFFVRWNDGGIDNPTTLVWLLLSPDGHRHLRPLRASLRGRPVHHLCHLPRHLGRRHRTD